MGRGVGLPVLLAIALQLGGYRYVPTDLATVPVGGHIRTVVNGTASDRLRATYGVAGPTLDGRIVAPHAAFGAVAVAVPLPARAV